jgi:hypothetical protein
MEEPQRAAIDRPIGFADLVLIRKRVELTETDKPYEFSFDDLNIDVSRYGAMLTSINHVAGIYYDVILAISVYPEDTIFETQNAVRLAVFEEVEDDFGLEGDD